MVLQAAPQAFSLRRISFVPAQRQDAHNVSAKDLGNLIPLNDPVEVPAAAEDGAMTRSNSKAAGRQGQAGPKKELFRAEDLSLHWREMRKAGAGLQNLGNTCFMNSVLQSLIHTPPLAELLLSPAAARLHNGAVNGFQPIQLARDLVSRSLQHASRSALAPVQFAKSLRRISRSFRLGRQEDAHEFLIALLDAMHEASIAGMNPKPAPELAQTSFVYCIFGGRMRSQVKCSSCGYESNTYDPCIDLSLEITRAQSVKRALERFTAGEVLDGANKYKCPKEQKGVRAVKRMTVDAAPNVLMIQLKRFEFSFSGHKISKKIDFDLELDLGPYMSSKPATPALYDLYAVLVHSGHSVHSGHYYAYVRAPNGIWHICDDTHVAQVAERQVMAQKAYILFYLKRQPGAKPPPAGSARGASASPASAAAAAAATTAAAKLPASITASSPVAQPARRQDVQQPGRQEVQQRAAAPAAAGPAAQGGLAKPLLAKSVKAAAAAAVAAAEGGSRKRKQLEPSTAPPGGAQAAPATAAKQAGSKHRHGEQQQPQEPQQNGRISKKPRLRALQRAAGGGGNDEDVPLASPMPRVRQLPMASPLVSVGLLLGRRGARLAEALSISQHPPLRSSRRRRADRHKAAAAAAVAIGVEAATAAASPGKAPAAPPAQREDSGAASGGGGGGVSSTSVVSAPDWPPVKRQQQGAQAAAAAADEQTDAEQPLPQQRHRQQRQRQQQQQQATAAAAAAPPATNGGGGGGSQADVRAFLRGSGGAASRLRLESWEEVDAEAKKQQAALLRKEAPKRRLQDDYDLEYDKGKTKKVRSKKEQEGGEGEAGGLDGHAFDAAWQQLQQEGVQTELRGNRKRRSQAFQQQQRRDSGGGRGGGPGRHGGRHGGRHSGRHSPGRGGRHGGGGGRGGRGGQQSFGGGRGRGRGRR